MAAPLVGRGGPGGGVYVFDGQIGACLGGGQLILPPEVFFRAWALEFSPHDGNLVLPWWSGPEQSRITVHDPLTGALLDTPIAAPLAQVSQAVASDFGPNGHLFVASDSSAIFEYDLLAEEVLGIFASQATPAGPAAAAEIIFKPLLGDADGDWDLDMGDFAAFQACFTGEGVTPANYNCLTFDHDHDGDVDLEDAAGLTAAMTGPIAN